MISTSIFLVAIAVSMVHSLPGIITIYSYLLIFKPNYIRLSWKRCRTEDGNKDRVASRRNKSIGRFWGAHPWYSRWREVRLSFSWWQRCWVSTKVQRKISSHFNILLNFKEKLNFKKVVKEMNSSSQQNIFYYNSSNLCQLFSRQNYPSYITNRK